jgi:pantetheine-phosphate adenylyltransferase
MKQIAIYPGTFDPPTNGHLDIIKRANGVFTKLVVAVVSRGPGTMFSAAERVRMLKKALAGQPNLEIETFSGLLTDYAQRRKATVVIRGLRVISDFEYEIQMALMNRRLKKDFEVMFLPPSEEYSFLSSSLVKEIASHGGDISEFVPAGVGQQLKKKLSVK